MVSLAALIVISPVLWAATPGSPEELRAAVEHAYVQKDRAALEALYYTEGLSEADKELNHGMIDPFWKTPPEIESVTIVPAPDGLTKVRIGWGKKWEPSLPPVGGLLVNVKNSPGSSFAAYGTTFAFGESAGKYYLVSAKTSDLGWKGPEDTTLAFMVMGPGQDKVKIRCRWNASGVDMEEIAASPAKAFVGQHIDSMTVASDSDNTDVTLTIRENNKVIYTSQPLKGKGTLEYKRP